MKIRFIKTLATQRQCFVCGSEHETEDAEAKRLIVGGVAVEVQAVAPEKVEEAPFDELETPAPKHKPHRKGTK